MRRAEGTCAELHREIADWCESRKLYGAARRHREALQAYRPDDAEVRAALARTNPPDDPDIPTYARRQLAEREGALADATVRAWEPFARWAGEHGHAAEAAVAWKRILEVRPDHPEAEDRMIDRIARVIPVEDRLPAAQRERPVTAALRDFLDRNLADLLREARDATGALPDPERPFRIVLTDVPPDVDFPGDPPAGWVAEREPIELALLVPRIPDAIPEPVLRRFLAHEVVHAVMLQQMGTAAHARLPGWFKEGIATFAAAGDGPDLLRQTLHRHDGSIEPALDGLSGGLQRLPEDYAEAYLFLRYLRDRLGADRLGRLIREIVLEGADVESAIAAACERPFDGLTADAHAWSREHAASIAAER